MTGLPIRPLLAVATAAVCLAATQARAGTAELTVDVSHYEYQETTSVGAFFMSDTSAPIFGSIGVRDWTTAPTDGRVRLLYTGELTYGQTDYASASSGTMTKDYYKARAEGYVAYRVSERFSPFVGLGYRTLFDASGGKRSSTGALGYDRLSQYLYAPLGVLFTASDRWNLKAQYNLFLTGRQTSYLSTASSAYGDIANDQHTGWGIDLAADYRINDRWTTYTFYRHWDIGKSDVSTGSVNGVVSFTAWEPDNTTDEFGIGLAYKF